MRRSERPRKLASLLALVASASLSLATSPPYREPEPLTRASLTVPMAAGETEKAVRVLATGYWMRLGLSAPYGVTAAIDPTPGPLDIRPCPSSDLSSCPFQSLDGFGDFVVRYTRPSPATTPIEIFVIAEVSGSSRVTSDFGEAMASGVDLELVP